MSLKTFFLTVLTGSAPFMHQDHDNTYRKIMNVDYKLPDYVGRAAAHFISKLLVFEPEKRMPLDQLEAHPWFTVHVA
jgi:aurora kinase A